MDLRTARFTAKDVPSHQSVEIRMIWPAGLVEGIPRTGRTIESIKAEEARFVQDTIKRAEKWAEDRAVEADIGVHQRRIPAYRRLKRDGMGI